MGVYEPDMDVLRYCTSCSAWYHKICLTIDDTAQSPKLEPFADSRPEQPDVPRASDDIYPVNGHKFTALHYKIWKRLLLHPIQRGYEDCSYPLSFESLVFDIRCHERRAGCPDDVFAYIDEVLNVSPHLVDKSALYKGRFLDLSTIVAYFQCPRCRAAI